MILLRTLQIELLKLKRTLAIWLILVTPLGIVFLVTMILLTNNSRLEQGYNPWEFIGKNSFGLWALMMLPLFVALETALLAGVEHQNNTWKHLLALSVPRMMIYFAKQILALLMIALSMVVLVFGALFAVLIVNALGLIVDADISQPIPWRMLIFGGLQIYLGTWLIVAIHTWLGIRWQSFTVAMGVGIMMTVTAMVLINTNVTYLFPWAMPASLAEQFTAPDSASPPGVTIVLSLVGTAVVSVLGAWEFSRRNVL